MPKRFRVSLTDRDYQRMLIMKSDDGFETKNISDWLSWKVSDVEIHPVLRKKMQRGTRSQLAPMWMKSFARNVSKVYKSTLNLRGLHHGDEILDRKCVVMGRGPSIFGGDNWWNKDHLSMIYESDIYQNDELTVLACDGILKDALKAGIVPDYVTTVDGSPVLEKWFSGIDPSQLETRNGEKTKMLVNISIDPGVVEIIEGLECPIYWFQAAYDNVQAFSSLTAYLLMMTCWEENPNGIVSIPSGGNVGTMTWLIAFDILGHSDVCLTGMTCGYPKGMPRDETYYWDDKLQGIIALQASTAYTPFHNLATKEDYYMDPVFHSYQQSFMDYVERKPKWLRLYNASSGCLYYPPYIESIELEDWLNG